MKEKWEEFKRKAADLWDRFQDKLAKALVWCIQNWQVTLTLLSASCGILKHILKIRKGKQEEEYKNRRFYDRRTDRWCYAKRHLNKKQQNIIEERYLDGESYRAILDSMGLLK